MSRVLIIPSTVDGNPTKSSVAEMLVYCTIALALLGTFVLLLAPSVGLKVKDAVMKAMGLRVTVSMRLFAWDVADISSRE